MHAAAPALGRDKQSLVLADKAAKALLPAGGLSQHMMILLASKGPQGTAPAGTPCPEQAVSFPLQGI